MLPNRKAGWYTHLCHCFHGWRYWWQLIRRELWLDWSTVARCVWCGVYMYQFRANRFGIQLEICACSLANYQEMNAKTRLFMSVLFTIIGLALGLLPGIDNFSHIGGFCVGILSGMVFAPSIHATRSHMVVIWVYRAIGGGLLIAYFLALVLNFYRSENPVDTCRWCRYLSCLPNFDACKGTGTSSLR